MGDVATKLEMRTCAPTVRSTSVNSTCGLSRSCRSSRDDRERTDEVALARREELGESEALEAAAAAAHDHDRLRQAVPELREQCREACAAFRTDQGSESRGESHAPVVGAGRGGRGNDGSRRRGTWARRESMKLAELQARAWPSKMRARRREEAGRGRELVRLGSSSSPAAHSLLAVPRESQAGSASLQSCTLRPSEPAADPLPRAAPSPSDPQHGPQPPRPARSQPRPHLRGPPCVHSLALGCTAHPVPRTTSSTVELTSARAATPSLSPPLVLATISPPHPAEFHASPAPYALQKFLFPAMCVSISLALALALILPSARKCRQADPVSLNLDAGLRP